jgi:hypothetical protein
MDAVNVSDIKDQIESLIGRAEAGESVEITRDGWRKKADRLERGAGVHADAALRSVIGG